MTISLEELGLYMGSVWVLWAIPGPVWLVLLARTLAYGFRGAWPIAVAVALGDIIWPLCAIFGLAWISSLYGNFLEVMRWVAAVVFIFMGGMLLRRDGKAMQVGKATSSPSLWAGFSVGTAAILGNPKAILFYMGILPGFFDVSRLNGIDIVIIVMTSSLVTLVGNLGLALFIDRVRRLISDPKAMRRTNIISGCLLILVGIIIPLT